MEDERKEMQTVIPVAPSNHRLGIGIQVAPGSSSDKFDSLGNVREDRNGVESSNLRPKTASISAMKLSLTEMKHNEYADDGAKVVAPV